MILADEASDEASIWQLVESCAYGADLAIWSELTTEGSSVLDLGCGIGRVARHLAAEGKDIVGVDRDPEMVADMNRLATEDKVVAITGDVSELASLELGRDRFEAIIAPQQLLHILGGEKHRHRLLAGVKRRLEPDGIAAFAINEVVPQESQTVDILPDLREIGESVYASRPVAVEFDPGSLTVVRLRQVVGQDGSLEETHDSITLDLIDRESLAAELAAAGLNISRMIEVPETDRHIASVIVVAGHDAGNS
ncbi:MAG: class I SAM-dependent methyltransferase [Solirubrobacterales bacterium]|nr:class I SAM-dependent methyltransferase [Solirubrobacterales bacterium]